VYTFVRLEVLPKNHSKKVVNPRGLEPLTSAVQRRRDRFQQLSQPCKIPANEPIPEKTLCCGFQVINPGCCTVAAPLH
jgi:hypothetical protein